MNIVRNIYKVARSVLFSAIILIAALYLILYILLSIPPVQEKIKAVAQTELTKFLGGEVTIEQLNIQPFNEVTVDGLKVMTPEKNTCLSVKRVGAGINIFRLLTTGEIELTYGEIIGLDAYISQLTEGGKLNIQFIIDAFAPKDKDKPKTSFDLKLRNVVLRRCRIRFDREWIPATGIADKLDFSHMVLTDLKADMTFPEIKNDSFKIDLRRMAFKVSGGLQLDKLAFRVHLTPTSLSVENLIVELPGTQLQPSDVRLSFKDYSDIRRVLLEEPHTLVMVDNHITPSDFKSIVPALASFYNPLSLSLEVSGDAGHLSIGAFQISEEGKLGVEFSGEASNLKNIHESEFSIDKLKVNATAAMIENILDALPPMSKKVRSIVAACGDVAISGEGHCDMAAKSLNADCEVITTSGALFVSGLAKDLGVGRGTFKGELLTENINLGGLLDSGKLGLLNANADFDIALKGKDINGDINLYVSDFDFNGAACGGIVVEAMKSGKEVTASVTVDNSIALVNVDGVGVIEGDESRLSVNCVVERLVPSLAGLLPDKNYSVFSGTVGADLMGSNIDNVSGEIRLSDFKYTTPDKSLQLDRLLLTSSFANNGRTLKLRSDWVDGDIEGKFKVREIPVVMRSLLNRTLPTLFPVPESKMDSDMALEFSFLLSPENQVTEFFNLPFRLLVPIPINGTIIEKESTATLSVDIPYIQQGRNKLVRDSRLHLSLDGEKDMFGVEIASTFPAKKGDLALDLRLWGEADDMFADIGWRNPDNGSFKGLLTLGAKLGRNELTSQPKVNVEIQPSVFDIGPACWNIDRSFISYDNKVAKVDNFRIWHDNQFVAIDGVASALPQDSISIRLADIDLDYVFDLLKINYVTFGGTATGDIRGKSVFSNNPVGLTDNLTVKGLSYNGCVLGDGYIRSCWDNREKEVTILADIMADGHRRAKVDGGIWITRDSLSFGIDAHKVPVEFLKPFMSAFTSDVAGLASGQAKLFGSFKDIDLTGRLFADTIAMKLDFTNTWYHGSDSVYLDPGHIIIPSFRLYDKNGHSAILTGDLTHQYFHDPRFVFRITDAHRLLCYDTNATLNPDWYGTIYGSGGAVVRGWPGMVDISVDMDVVSNSTFTFVLNDTEAAADYHFLTFSDRRKEEKEKMRRDTVPDVLAQFRKQIEMQENTPSRFSLDIRASVSPTSLMTIVMDPIAGDKITARGNGAIQVDYESDTEEMQMFGKYTLEEGNYNFSLQDLILRDFSIRPGSAISFNGDPLNADLDITASYRVNTNLSDLDKSFSTDKDLTRINVPVDALLMVKGEMQHPDITFDLELPTLTQDVERKVKSIISTDDMMSRQIIYLLALNRFYTPEYMGSTSNGGELAAVASTTLSSQLSNMLGQLTDKFTFAPSFRSDKGDFSDLEVDVMLSSRLLNNRLLVNGNFGYRDRNTSTTTFVGDFDIEYLLNRRGNLRLKAYNHFNDQNYYLREALTTQGIGVVFRQDFDNPFSFLKRWRRKEETTSNTD